VSDDGPSCAARLEFDLRVADMVRDGSPEHVNSAQTTVTVGGRRLRFRLPDSLDLAAAAQAPSRAAARRVLVERCVRAARANRSQPLTEDAAEQAAMRIGERLSRLDPLATFELDVHCDACGQTSATPLDVVDYVWSELTMLAGRLLREVHVLATAYGWSEADILALSDTRRQAYLDVVQS
jgi:hypothetical protein